MASWKYTEKARANRVAAVRSTSARARAAEAGSLRTSARKLNLLALGDDVAAGLGEKVALARGMLYDPHWAWRAAAALGRLGGHEEALALYRQILDARPDEPKIWMSYGHALKTAGHTARAIDVRIVAATNRNLAVEGKGKKGDPRPLQAPGTHWEYNDVRVNRLSLAEEINRRAAAAGNLCRILVEVNLGGEESKSGVAPDEAPGLIRAIAAGSGRFTETVPVLDKRGHLVPTEVERECVVDIALRWGTGYDTTFRSYVNIIATPKGGTNNATTLSTDSAMTSGATRAADSGRSKPS